MRTALKLLLAALATTLAMGFAASSATAQAEFHVEPEDEPGTSCSVLDPCEIHAESTESLEHPTSVLEVFVPGHLVFSRCHDEFEGEIREDGTGHITNQVLRDPTGQPGACTRQACDSAGEAEWPFELEENSPGNEVIHVDFCLEPIGGGAENHCDVELPITDEGDHHYVIEATDEPCAIPDPPFTVFVSGEWELEHGHPLPNENHQPIEISHSTP
jgi:hypothetical protein